MTAKPTDVVTVIMTAPNAETAEELGRTLVSERVAACANVVPNIVSMYWWEGELQRDDEAMVILKTVRQRAEALEARAVVPHGVQLALRLLQLHAHRAHLGRFAVDGRHGRGHDGRRGKRGRRRCGAGGTRSAVLGIHVPVDPLDRLLLALCCLGVQLLQHRHRLLQLGNAVRLLLDAGADVTDTLPDGMSTVVLAATNAHWELGVWLVDRGADPNAAEQGWSALHAMTWVRMPNFGFNPPGPVTTGTMDSLTFARELVARGADVNAQMTAEPRNGYRNALNRVGATPLLMAARLADAPYMRVLVELGADPTITNEDGTSVLMVASGVGIHSPGEDTGSEAEALACVEVALELGGDPNAIDQTGETALHGAAYRGANSIVHLLVEHGANTFDVENEAGWTPLRIAQGIFRTATFKEAPHTAALLGELMAARQGQP